MQNLPEDGAGSAGSSPPFRLNTAHVTSQRGRRSILIRRDGYLVMVADGKPVLALLRGDHQLNQDQEPPAELRPASVPGMPS